MSKRAPTEPPFSDLEEAFFAAGEALSRQAEDESPPAESEAAAGAPRRQTARR